MKHKKTMRAVAIVLGTALGVGTLGAFSGCKKKEVLTIMTEALDGLFNPFFSTSAADNDIIGLTQLSMFSTNSEGKISYGNTEPTVVLDYKTEYDSNEQGDPGKEDGVTTYYFVLKNGITFSDGKPLTMNDVLFNMYVYLDPVYSGSSTMYSTDIVGLSQYRTQKSGSSTDESLTQDANTRAQARIQTLIDLYQEIGRDSSGSTTYSATEAQMREAIKNKSSFDDGYKHAISAKPETLTDEDCRQQLLADYDFVLTKFREELTSDYASAKDSFKEEPYKSRPEFQGAQGEVNSFMYMEGYITLKYKQQAGSAVDRNQIESVEFDFNKDTINTEEKAINHVFNDKVETALDEILLYYGTASKVRTDFASKAMEVILHEGLDEGELAYKNIGGIVSMGHSTDQESIQIGEKTYHIAQAADHNEDGTVKGDKYDVLRIKINGIDPKAVWNFGFTVAPHHYYSDAAQYPVNIAENKFGVEWGSYDFMNGVVQGGSKNRVPIGAGPYAATDRNFKTDKPDGGAFYNSNIVYYKANDGFLLGAPKIKNLCYQVVSSTNAIDTLKSGNVHFVTPQMTPENVDQLDGLKGRGIQSTSTWQLGYGYIGINAGKVTDINLRRAIMSAMDTKRAIRYYGENAVQIAYPMSVVSWAYPRVGEMDPAHIENGLKENNGKPYTMFVDDNQALENIRNFTSASGMSGSALKFKFTIAGSNLTEHPVYSVFQHAADLLNQCGWSVEVVPDLNALTKLSSGSLAVWAAAWGSTIDPDMYQVYHKNSSATSTNAWGYREILANSTKYAEENRILNDLSTEIDLGRTMTDETERAEIYERAMGYVLELAVELPVYQRKELYAYNAKVINEDTLPKVINSYSSPLGRIWEIEFAK